MKKFLSGNFFPLFLIFIAILISYFNYVPGTFLSGWDTLHPEFNFPEYFKRILFGVWQEHQGLGAVSSQAHPSEFPRMLLYYPLSFILPLSFLRYSYFFICLILGPLGIYYFAKKNLLKEENSQNKIASFLGALFYLFNLGTIQHFFVPLEMFAAHYATLPWLFLFLIQYLENGRRRDLIWFSIFTFFSASIAHTSTLWFAYFLSLSVFIFAYNSIERKRKLILKSIKIILLTLLINSFWLLPNLYFILTKGNQVINSKINSLFTEEAFANNKLFGTLPDILIFKSFLFNWNAYIGNGQFGSLLSAWIDHLKNPFVLSIGYLFSAIAIIGIIKSFLRKNLIAICLFTITLVSVFFLLTDNPPFGFFFKLLQNIFPLFNEAIRFPFTKFSILLMFTMGCFFALGQKLILEKIKKFKLVYLFICLLGYFYFMWPAFQGNLISPLMKVKIPQDYFSAFEFLNKKPYGRISSLPIHSFWAWNYFDWKMDRSPSYQGAGFTWFGFNKPILEREFDRWNPSNEQYYREMSQAIYSEDEIRLNNVLNKYDIAYILFDKTIIAPDQTKDDKALFRPETEKILSSNSKIKKVAEFGNLLIYETDMRKPQVRIIQNPISIGPKGVFYDDPAYNKYNDYITYPTLDQNNIIFPFRNIIDNQSRIISSNIASSFPNPTGTTDSFLSKDINDCPTQNSTVKKETLKGSVKYTSQNGSYCQHLSFPTLLRNQAYVVAIESRNIEGLPIRLCARNYITSRCDLFAHLSSSNVYEKQFFLIPPIDESIGLDVNINNFSIKNQPSINEIRAIQVYPFNYQLIDNARKIKDEAQKNVITYSQAFDPGWKAYETELKTQNSKLKSLLVKLFPFFFGKELKQHVLVNNWSNGWIAPDSLIISHSSLIIIYWPQYLEYIGLALLSGVIFYLLLAKK